MQSLKVSQLFIDYFEHRGFTTFSGGSLLHPSVPMTFVMSAGLAQVELALNDSGTLPSNGLVFSQTCFRHFDVNKVGESKYHLTLFEMPAAFWFGAFSRKEVIDSLWRLLTTVLGIDAKRVWITYFSGEDDAFSNFAKDNEAEKAWLDVGLPLSRILGRGLDSNFWRQGSGFDGVERYRKLGPNTEVFYDFGKGYACGKDCAPGCTCGRFVEIANCLFVGHQLDIETNEISTLSLPFCEAVIGAERITMILEGKTSVFEIDSIEPIIHFLQTFKYDGTVRQQDALISERVIVDHLRTLVFLVAHGAPPPGKDGRQKIMKKLIRETISHMMYLGIWHPSVLTQLANIIVDFYQNTDVRIPGIKNRLLRYLNEESLKYEKTVERGKRKISQFYAHNHAGILTMEQKVCLTNKYGLHPVLIDHLLRTKL